MNKRRRKLMFIILAVILCLAAGLAAVYLGLIATAEQAEKEYRSMVPIDLNAIADGVYRGTAGRFICSIDLTVTVKDHQIAGITVNRQLNGGGEYEAGEMYPRIIEGQSCGVDTVSGATLTSKTILVAVNRALAQGFKK